MITQSEMTPPRGSRLLPPGGDPPVVVMDIHHLSEAIDLVTAEFHHDRRGP
jgi:hypothetical protein